ncbi:MAG TPA: alpha-L-arabinofuranosidase C-terminal domain-containing protein [Candidatus Acidoferrales bacterium]|nr:alpha-L-arabinofuranosidase C-terminal domain-containing protein [Candidatus Acidoferrales bacterium]
MIRKRWMSLGGFVIISLGLNAAVLGPKQPIGEIPNPSIEIVDSNNQPANWTVEPAGRGNTNPSAQVSSDTAHDGTHSLMISAGGVSWLDKVLLKPYAKYRLTGWIKTQDVPLTSDGGARFELRGVKVTSPSGRINGTQDWTNMEITFDTDGQDSAIIVATLGARAGRPNPGGETASPPAPGKAWFDDLKLELISARTLNPTVSIDVTKTREPMPDLVYGQFIEHLGRSIYGGIWAEMLEDRKFYSAVGETRRDRVYVPSPWKAVGDAGSVSMVTENAFVGEHTPQVNLGNGGMAGGITQSGLGLVAGKAYEGYVIVAGDSSAAPVEVSLHWGDGEADSESVTIKTITKEFKKIPIRFTARASTDSATFTITGKGRGKFLIGTASLMPADNVNGMRADTLAQLKQLDAPIYRWPGGNFVSGYNWKDGIGDRDKRPPRKNPAWTGIEHNDFGLHEYFEFLKVLNAQPFIALNAGLGGADSAAQEVEYVNGGPDTPMGKLRAKNGHPRPFHCTYWAVGNEMSGSWQLGNVPIAEFVKRHNGFSQKLYDLDKSIQLVASGDAVRPSSDWDRQLLSNSSDYINLISKHFYRQDWHGGGLMTHVRQIGDAIHGIAEAHRNYLKTIPEMKGKNIRVSLDEWNYWYGPHVFGELGTRYFLRDALGIAGGINEFSRDTDVIALACYAQTVNVIGAIKTSKTAAVLDSTGEALVMYRRHFGSIPVEITGASEPLDVAVAWTKDKEALTISVINPTYETQHLAFTVEGAKLDSQGESWVLTGPDDMAFNDPGKDPVVKFMRIPVPAVGNSLEVQPVSATIFVIKVR